MTSLPKSNPKLKLAIDLRPLLDPFESGVSLYTKALVDRFLKNPQLTVDLFYQSQKHQAELEQRYPQVRHLPYSNRWFHLCSLLRFSKLPPHYFLNPPDLIWLPDRRSFYKTKIPIVMTIHDQVPEKCSSTLSLKSWLWHKIFPLKRLLSLCSGILCPSFTVKTALEKIAPSIPKEVSFEGAELSKEEQEPSHSGVLKGKLFFLFIAPADPRKRVDWLLRAAQRFPKVYFVWVGQKKNDRRFTRHFSQQGLKQSHQKKLPNLLTYSEISEEEKKWFLTHARALLALSKHEGFDLPVLEAVRAHCPVIMSDLPVHHELYKDNGYTVRTEEELHSALYRAIQNKPPLLKVRGDYTWKRAAQHSLLFFFRVLRNKNG